MFALPGCLAQASGKLQLQANMNEEKQVRPLIGLSIYQPLFHKRLALNSWTGYGNQASLSAREEDTNWFVAKNELKVIFKSWAVAPGHQFVRDFTVNESRNYVYLKVEKVLW